MAYGNTNVVGGWGFGRLLILFCTEPAFYSVPLYCWYFGVIFIR
jgi:hypothetical protein